MAGKNEIDLDFADGAYHFALPLVRITELEAKCGAPGPPDGIGLIFQRLLKGCVQIGDEVKHAPILAEFKAIDIIETIRQGLIGGGYGVVNGQEVKVTAIKAQQLIDTYVLTASLSEHWSTAISILQACICGYEPPKKD